MNDYILLMHNDSGNTNSDDWNLYVTKLNQLGCFDGGSSIGGGKCISKKAPTKAITEFLSGYMRIKAKNIDHAQELLKGNPVFESGGTIEIRELTRS